MKLEFLLCLCFTLFALPSCRPSEDGKNLLFEGEGDNAELKKILSNVGKFQPLDVDDDEDDDDESGGWSGSGDDGSGGSSGVEPSKIPKTTKGKDQTTGIVVDITLVSKKTTDSINCVDCQTDTPTIGPNETGDNNDDGENDKNVKTKEEDKEKGGVNFTVGIIIGVVVGAVLAIMIIVFLVYRLRKKDEGSYSLDEQSSTAYLRGDTDSPKGGKEYFA